MARKWTSEEDTYLVDHAYCVPFEEIIRHLGRSEASCRCRLHKLGAAKKPDVLSGVFGRLTVIRVISIKTSARYTQLHECLCECGNQCLVSTKDLKRGNRKSCGCIPSGPLPKHGYARTRLYNIWHGMIARCYNENDKAFKYYGARQILVHESWHDVFQFHQWAWSNGYEDGLTLDRIDNDAGYGPDNCRWATYQQQANNRRNNHTLYAFGESKTISEWSRDSRCLVSRDALRSRLKLAWDTEKAISTPSGKIRDESY